MSMPAMFCHAVFAQYIDSEEVSKERDILLWGVL